MEEIHNEHGEDRKKRAARTAVGHIWRAIKKRRGKEEVKKLISTFVLSSAVASGVGLGAVGYNQAQDAKNKVAHVKAVPGPQGTSGSNGVNGVDGKNGLDGIVGVPGINGVDGLDGINGKDGNNGLDGINGTNGTNGTDGSPGIQGPVGPQGAQGTPGANGEQGPAGPQGEPGQQGQTGPGAKLYLQPGPSNVFGAHDGGGSSYVTEFDVEPGTYYVKQWNSVNPSTNASYFQLRFCDGEELVFNLGAGGNATSQVREGWFTIDHPAHIVVNWYDSSSTGVVTTFHANTFKLMLTKVEVQ